MTAQNPAPKPHMTKKILPAALALGVLLAAAIAFLLYNRNKLVFSGNNPQHDDGRMESDLLRLSGESYEAAMLSMHSTAYFTEDDFLYYRGLRTLVTSHAILDTEELSQYLDCILRPGNAVSDLYLCLDPELLWTGVRQKSSAWDTRLRQDLYAHIADHPETTFSILLPYPYIAYWLELTEEQLEILLTLYHTLVNELYQYPNVRVFFPGGEIWLTLNPGNYTDMLFDANELITRSVFLHTFCDGDYLIYPANAENYWATLRETVAREKSSPTRHADLSDWCVVFFGDSVLGNYPGSFSIPGYVSGLSDALTCNFAVGGTPATYEGPEVASFPNVVDTFLAENDVSSEDGSCFAHEDFSPEELADKKLCFVINYGFNDYFTGDPVENPEDPDDIRTFKGSLRTCVSRLTETFPEACVILMTPTHTQSFSCGTDVNGERGSSLSVYIEAIAEAAEDTGALLLDNYSFIATEDDMVSYLADGVHPNENGRLLIADRIIRFIETELH